MTLEITLLVLESLLLGFTIWLLVTSIKEGRSRDSLIGEVSRAVRVLSRHEYFITVVDTMMDAEREVLGCITGRLPKGEDRKRTQEVIYTIEKLVKNGVSVKYLMPKFQDRLHVGFLYTRAGAEVRYSACAMSPDLRYMVVDDRAVVIGIPAGVGEKEATRQGYKVPSEGLSTVLDEHFQGCWDGSVTYDDYLKDTLAHTGADIKTLARELEIDEGELRRVTQQ